MRAGLYVNGEEAVLEMIWRLEYLNLYSQDNPLSKEDMDSLKLSYQHDRDAARAFGEDVSDLPRRLKVTTRLPTLAVGPSRLRSYIQ